MICATSSTAMAPACRAGATACTTGWARTRPSAASATASRHQEKRISPSRGWVTLGATRASSSFSAYSARRAPRALGSATMRAASQRSGSA